MTDIRVEEQGPHAYDVDVIQGGRTTEHHVTVPDGMATEYAGRESELVRASFEFLLEREPASSILGRFSLDVIARYFPEYPQEIAGRMA